MKASWLHDNDRINLIVFCNGWGMDGTPFQTLESVDYDVYMVYDYRRLTGQQDIKTIAGKYQQIHLVGWSMGVWIGQKLFLKDKDLFTRTIAINGTLCPINDTFGIPENLFRNTFEEYSEVVKNKFYRRMCRDKNNLKTFLKNQPQRSLQSQRDELSALLETVDCISVENSIYREILISENDFVVPSANQLRYWQGQRLTLIPGFHFLFNDWKSWDHLLSFSNSDSHA